MKNEKAQRKGHNRFHQVVVNSNHLEEFLWILKVTVDLMTFELLSIVAEDETCDAIEGVLHVNSLKYPPIHPVSIFLEHNKTRKNNVTRHEQSCYYETCLKVAKHRPDKSSIGLCDEAHADHKR